MHLTQSRIALLGTNVQSRLSLSIEGAWPWTFWVGGVGGGLWYYLGRAICWL